MKTSAFDVYQKGNKSEAVTLQEDGCLHMQLQRPLVHDKKTWKTVVQFELYVERTTVDIGYISGYVLGSAHTGGYVSELINGSEVLYHG